MRPVRYFRGDFGFFTIGAEACEETAQVMALQEVGPSAEIWKISRILADIFG